VPYPRRLLTGDEDVVVELHPHWTYLGRALPATVAAAAVVVAAAVAWPSAPVAVSDILLGVLVVCGLWLSGRVLRWRRTSLVVTTQRVVQRSGVVARRGVDVRLDRVNEISYHQTIRGRLLGTGELVVELGGEAGVVVFDHVPRPAALAGVLHEQISALRPGPGGSGAWARHGGGSMPLPPADTPPAGMRRVAGRTGSVAEQLLELDELFRRGVLTEDEFTRKKAELLDRM